MARALRSVVFSVLLFSLAAVAVAQDDVTRLLQDPTISDDLIVFAYAGDLWRVGYEGGEAERLTSFEGVASSPRFSPDGSLLAFSGRYQGQTDVYLVPVTGGTPERLTYHPGADQVQGWHPDGTQIVFRSARDSAPASYARFWSISLTGGLPTPLDIPRGDTGGYSPDGEHFVYQPITRWQEHWRGYRGGQVNPIWLLNMDNYELTELPSQEAVDTRPVWKGDSIYFLSDRGSGVTNIFSYDVDTRSVDQVTDHLDFDVKALAVNNESIVYEQAMQLHQIDRGSGNVTTLAIDVRGDLPWTQNHWKDVGDNIMHAGLSPTGQRAIFEARGEIFTVPREEGDWRNVSRAPAAADRFPQWSPEGSRLAWFSDRNGEYQLLIASQNGLGEITEIELPESFYYYPRWSPDGTHIQFTDESRTLWMLNVETEELTEIDGDLYAHPQRSMDPTWSPDGQWIAYAKRMHNQFRTIHAYSLRDGEIVQLTDGMSDAVNPVWDKNGKYLYFMASTNYGLNTGWLDMSSYDRPVERALYLAVLPDDEPSPLLPRSDEEPTDSEEDDEQEDEESASNGELVEVRIDIAGLDQRIVSLDVPQRTYAALYAAKEGVLFFGEHIQHEPGLRMHRYLLAEREAEPYLDGVSQFEVAHNGEYALYQAQGQWGIVEVDASPSVGDGSIDVSGLRMRVSPNEEWQQLFDDAWRFNRDYLYVDNHHGLDWAQIRELYEPLLNDVHHRADLNYLLALMVGELSLGHTYVGGGDIPDGDGPGTGLLGVDFEIDQNRYRFARIFGGESWNPELRAPLREPGTDVDEGDYLLGVNGTELTADMNPYELFEGTVDRQVSLLVNDEPTLDGAREITVVPIASEGGLRTRAWVEDNRRYVDEVSDGQLAYAWVPNTAQAGYESFNRYYFAQQDRTGAIIDERFNGGGSAADYMVDIMARELHGFFNNPIGDRDPFTSPGAGIWGPKVMIVNEAAGSGGDLLPYMFKRMDIGPIVGTRTWGGLVGIWDTPPLIDGGTLTVPRGGFYDLDGEWAVENEGVAPDIEVIQTPRDVIEGRDPQLDRAIQEALNHLPDDDPIRPEPAPPTPAPRN